MKRYVKKIIGHPFFAGSVVMIIGSNLANFFASLYHFVLVRFLSLSLYADLAVVIAVIGMFSAVFSFIGLVVVKFVSQAKDKDEVRDIFSWFFKITIIVGLILLIVLTLAIPIISNFLHINVSVTALIGPILFISLLGLVLKSFLQGLLKFKSFVTVTNIEIIGRVVFGVALVVLGLGVFGGVLGILLSVIVSLIIVWYMLSDYRKITWKSSFKGGNAIVKFTLPVFLFSLASTSLLTTDIILVKHFINSTDAALYDALSTVGKIILYGSGPVGAVMFPIISKKYSKGERYVHIFLLSFGLTLLFAIAALFVYFFFPGLPIGILYGSRYVVAAGSLIWFGLFAAVFSLSSLVVSFYLSLGKTKIVGIVVIYAIMQILGILLIHDSIVSVAKVNLGVTSFLLASLLIYLGYEEVWAKRR